VKTIDIATETPTLQELLDLASGENVLLRTPEGREFVLAEVDDFDKELELIRQNTELMDLLARRSQETKRLTLDQVRAKLDL